MRPLAIVGTHSATRHLAPFDDPAYEIWVFNEAPQQEWCKRWDVCFQIHKPEVYESKYNMVKSNHWEWLQQWHGEDKIIYIQDVDHRIPNGRVYPLLGVKAMTPDRLITSTAAMALALAIMHGYDDIHIYGIELSSNSEYSWQLQGWLYWVGFARGVGYASDRDIRLELHSGQMHFDAKTYGYDGDPNLNDLFSQRIEILQSEWKAADAKLRRWDDRLSAALLDRKFQDVAELAVDVESIAMNCGAMAGALSEAELYARRGDVFTPRQEIERHMAKAQQEGEQLKSVMNHTGGKVEYVFNVWHQTGNLQALQQLRQFLKEKRQAAYDCGARLGIYQENLLYMNEYDDRLTAMGGERALRQLEVANGNH